MKKITLAVTLILLGIIHLTAQNPDKERAKNYLSIKGELTFTFQVENHEDVPIYTKNLSLINYNPNTKTVIAWANEAQFRYFEALNIPFQVPENENEVKEATIYDVRPLANRNAQSTLSFPVSSYPTYTEYAQQMQDFEDDYPALVETFSIGATGQGDKELLFVKISDNVSTDEQEPKLMFTSSMHGDEIAGYPMMLSLINYILTVYSDTGHADHARVKNLVENTELWINPSANPDGTYHNSPDNTSVANARRGNANNIDLNRNYPDNKQGAHTDGNAYQTETLHFMQLAEDNHFVISANFHGGTELVNYPFDNAYVSEYTHPDGDWFENISVEYATHCQTDANSGNTATPSYTNKSSYMTDDDDSDVYPSQGVTHGAEWYRVFGGRQDYMNFYHQCREVTIELSDVKILPESSLVDYWYYNRDALLDYLTQGTYGFRGVVKDSNYGTPIEATVTIVGHDAYGSNTISDAPHGDFYRPINAGTYDIMFEAPCYQPVTIYNQTIANYEKKVLADILMTLLTPAIPGSLSVTDIVSSSVTLNWITTSGSSFDLRYREVGSGTWIEILDIDTDSYSLTGLTPNTSYEYEVRSNCGTNSSEYSTLDNFTTGDVSYCNAEGNSIADEYIGEVNLNGTANNSESSTLSGYSNYKGMSIFSPIEIGSTGNSISVKKHWDGTQYREAVSVWIDYNQDGIFSSSEKVLEEGASVNPQTVSSLFTVPSSAKTGDTVMRVLMKYYNASNQGTIQDDPCETFDYGEVEDYTINFFENTLSISDQNMDLISVYPNPFKNTIDVKLPSNMLGNTIVFNIYDVLGRSINTNKLELNNQTVRLFTQNDLKSGSYILKIYDVTTNSTVVKQLIKQ
ncbi:M14 family zinc carboxypeptidase [uncultured Winogradskyella sp.]|uniref:M14 family zinc carboxypeptidase n=1 Tax=uncultured Winogradskyella sp. TaxID=395353 RepID=UPI002602E7DE|nr:M14 family zinc carboxypeptidase [uncultured Winogradskyella sp.]